MKKNKFLVVTTNEIPNMKIVDVLGVCKGSTVRSRNIARDIGAGFKNIVGGEIKTYTEMANTSREEAYNRMVNHAIEMGADAVVAMRFSTSMIMQGAAEMIAYGTAVKLK
ncbi:MAG: YbjQ family protein [Bacteroidales bacterium]|nr:YbjQ family protein [Bacteroidales bacterium]